MASLSRFCCLTAEVCRADRIKNSIVEGMEEGEAQEIVSCRDQSWPEASHSTGRTVLLAFPSYVLQDLECMAFQPFCPTVSLHSCGGTSRRYVPSECPGS